MAFIIVNGCFDVFHEGHRRFLWAAKNLVHNPSIIHLIAAINSDESARRLKSKKWGEKYPIDSLETRMANVKRRVDGVASFNEETELWQLIYECRPCILCKGPDYAGKPVTGDDIAPVLILDTPEPEAVKQMKREVYGVVKP
jgi:D-beta-D-heptose 7-phosphate kinase/D-beta-D-heptose 1-phosphate adenosyltransferase